MRIAFIGLAYPFRGGIAHYSTLLFRELQKKHEVKFISLSRQYPKLLFPGKTQLDYSNESLKASNEPCLDSLNPWTWYRTYREIRLFKPDLLLVSWWHPFFAPSFGSVARLAKTFASIPVSYLCHNAGPHEPSFIDKSLTKFAFGPGEAFIAHSKTDLEQLKHLCPNSVICHSPHPNYEALAKKTFSKEEARRELRISENLNVILFFGYIRKYKGLDYLLDAMLNLDDNNHLLLVGEFYDSKAKYQSRLEQLSSRGKLTIVDRYVPNEEIPLYFSACDIVSTPYITATQSGIIQLAYAFHKPVISTNVGGLPEVVKDGETGFITPPEDAKALAEAILKFVNHPDKKSFKKNIESEANTFSWDHMIETIERIPEALK